MSLCNSNPHGLPKELQRWGISTSAFLTQNGEAREKTHPEAQKSLWDWGSPCSLSSNLSGPKCLPDLASTLQGCPLLQAPPVGVFRCQRDTLLPLLLEEAALSSTLVWAGCTVKWLE